jgi:hypothetical protein
MKSLRLNIITLVSGLALVLSGCEHKKQPLIMPQQQPPTVAPSPTPAPEATPPQTAEADKTQQTEPLPDQAKQEPGQVEKKETPKHAAKPSPRKPATGDKSTAEVARNSAGKKVIPAEKAEPTPAPGPIAPGPTPADTHGQASTDQLLQVAESNLNGIKRTLSKEEEAMRAQIREFITQSRKATTENDLARAYNLAVKARVLSDELVKQR